MFDLEQRVDAYCRSVAGGGCGDGARVEELRDHLHCEIDRLRGEGLSDRDAFDSATRRLGNPTELGAEFAKNRSLLSILAAAECGATRSSGSKKSSKATLIGTSLFFAALMIAAPLVINDDGKKEMIVFAVLLPLWFVVFLFQTRGRSVACEWRFLKRVFRFAR